MESTTPTEVTYISPPTPSGRKEDEKRMKRTKEYAKLLATDHVANNDASSDQWNTILTWLLALFALSLLPFALHYGIKKHHDRNSPELVATTNLQGLSDSIFHSAHHHHGKKQDRVCVCTVRRINKATGEVQTASTRIPIKNRRLFATPAKYEEECERLCAQERLQLMESLELKSFEKSLTHSLEKVINDTVKDSIEKSLSKQNSTVQKKDEFGDVLLSSLLMLPPLMLAADAAMELIPAIPSHKKKQHNTPHPSLSAEKKPQPQILATPSNSIEAGPLAAELFGPLINQVTTPENERPVQMAPEDSMALLLGPLLAVPEDTHPHHANANQDKLSVILGS